MKLKLKFICFVFLTQLMVVNTYAQKKNKVKQSNTKNELSGDQKLKKDFLFISGLKEKEIGNNVNAQQFFNQILDFDQNDAAVYYEIAKANLALNDFNSATLNAKKACELSKENFWYWDLLASIYDSQRNAVELKNTYSKMVDLFPDRIEVLFDYANSLLVNNDYNAALKVYDKIQDKIGVNEELAIQKQRIYLRINKVDKAANEIEALIKLNPSEFKNYMLLGDMYASLKLNEKAFEYYSKALEIDKENGYLQLVLADYYRAKGKGAQSYDLLKTAFRNLDLNIDEKVRILAGFFAQIENPTIQTQALELSQILTELYPNEAKAYAIYGDFLYQLKKSKEAREKYYESLKYQKDIFAVWQNILFIDGELNDNKALLDDSKQAIELFPEQVILYYFNGAANLQLKNISDGLAAYQTGIKIGTTNTDLLALLHSGLGECYNENKEFTKSDSAFNKALELKPKDDNILNNYAYYLSLRNEKLELAESMSKLSNQLRPDMSSYEDTYAWILYKLGRLEEAKIWIEKAIKNATQNSPTLIEHYGDILFKLGSNQMAVDSWKKAKEFGGKSEYLDKKIADKKLYE